MCKNYRLHSFCIYGTLLESRLYIGLIFLVISMGAATCGELLVHDIKFKYRHNPTTYFVHYGFILTLLIHGLTNLLEYCNNQKNKFCIWTNITILAIGIGNYVLILIIAMNMLLETFNLYLFGILLFVSPTIVFSLYSSCILFSYYCDLQEEDELLHQRNTRRRPLDKMRVQDEEIELCYTVVIANS